MLCSWKRMVRGVRVNEREQCTFGIFFITDQVEKGNLMIEYCPTTDMVADYFTKPLQGEKFQKIKAIIMGTEYNDPAWTKVPPKTKKRTSRRQECVRG